MTWNNVEESCQLCEMDKRTKWYKETDEFIVAEKLGGGPFVIVKDHVEELDEEQLQRAHDLVDEIFGEHQFKVLMNLVKDHWHAHIITDNQEQDLTGE